MATNYNYFGGLVTNGLVLDLDAAKLASYPGTGTTWRDISGNNNNGTLINSPSFSGIGKQAAIIFDGTDDYIDCGNNINLQLNQGTISAWVRTSSPGNSYRAIIAKQNNYGLFTFENILIAYDWGNSSNRSTGINIADGTWKNVVMTFTTNTGTPSNNAIVYLNGSAVLTTTIKILDNLVELQLASGGRLPNTPVGTPGQQFLNGRISSALVYNRALSTAEVAQNFNALRGRYGI
jgi:hypothetical protein